MTIDSNRIVYVNGKVGIGTASVDRMMHVYINSQECSVTWQNDAQKFKIGLYDFGSGDDQLFIHHHQSAADNLKLSAAGALWIRGELTEDSDERLKTNIQTIPSALSKVTQMRGVSYDRIDNGEIGSIGLIAQELELIAPELVTTSAGTASTGDTPKLEDSKSIAYTKIGAYLVEAIKELSAEVTALKNA